MANSAIFKSSIGKKVLMGLTGLFLIIFLLVHASINGMIWYNDGGETFSHWAHFMGTNPIIRIMEIVLVLGFVVHIADGIMLYLQNRAARPQGYAYSKAPEKSKWYSRSMMLLGTLILIFLIVHTTKFWIPNRTSQFVHGEELNLYNMMLLAFRENALLVIFYVAGCFSLFWHLLHGFKSAFQSLGLNHVKYNETIYIAGIVYAIIIPTVFAMMPISIYLGWVK